MAAVQQAAQRLWRRLQRRPVHLAGAAAPGETADKGILDKLAIPVSGAALPAHNVHPPEQVPA